MLVLFSASLWLDSDRREGSKYSWKYLVHDIDVKFSKYAEYAEEFFYTFMLHAMMHFPMLNSP